MQKGWKEDPARPTPLGPSQALSEVFAMAAPHFWHIYIKDVSRRVWAEDTGSMAPVRVSLTRESVALSPGGCWGGGRVLHAPRRPSGPKVLPFCCSLPLRFRPHPIPWKRHCSHVRLPAFGEEGKTPTSETGALP